MIAAAKSFAPTLRMGHTSLYHRSIRTLAERRGGRYQAAHSVSRQIPGLRVGRRGNRDFISAGIFAFHLSKNEFPYAMIFLTETTVRTESIGLLPS